MKSDNSIGPKGGRSVGEGITKCGKLIILTLDLTENNICDEGVAPIGEGIS